MPDLNSALTKPPLGLGMDESRVNGSHDWVYILKWTSHWRDLCSYSN